MKRNKYFEYISEKLHILSNRIETAGRLNLLNLHTHSENFYLHFFNLLYNYNLENLNKEHQNVEAIDLIDYQNKVIIQVSAICTKEKIELALSKDIIKQHKEYNFKLILISKDASGMRKKSFINPYSIKFIPSKDIYDITKILRDILSKNIDEIEDIYDFIKKELGGEVDIIKLDRNLATIINILSKEQWDETNQTITVDSFEIERKITFNDLKKARYIIKEYFVYHTRIDEIYSEFDTRGANKSNSVLASIRRIYYKLKFKDLDADSIFFSVIDSVTDIVLNSPNFEQIPMDELELCIDILVVDAFIRCKIFENPEGYNYASS